MSFQQRQFFSSIPESWQEPLRSVCTRPEIDALISFLKDREAAGAVIYPAKKNIFAALRATPIDQVKVVIVGQDPYHGPGQAHGLSFSVPPGVPQPPSLKNIFKELRSDLGITPPAHGTLTGWAKQGVLLLNAMLTVEQGAPASHAGKGWELFTDEVIKQVLLRKKPTVFMLWGAYAQKKVLNLKEFIDPTCHLILTAAHPSPFSVTGFLGCSHFSKANTFLYAHGLDPVVWSAL